MTFLKQLSSHQAGILAVMVAAILWSIYLWPKTHLSGGKRLDRHAGTHSEPGLGIHWL